MFLNPVGTPVRVNGRLLKGALDIRGRIWLCELSSCGNFIDPVYAAVADEEGLENVSLWPYIKAVRQIRRELREKAGNNDLAT